MAITRGEALIRGRCFFNVNTNGAALVRGWRLVEGRRYAELIYYKVGQILLQTGAKILKCEILL